MLYFNEPNSVDIETKSSIPKVDSVVNFFTEITKKIERETSSFKYEILVDKKTGLAFKVKNADEYLNTIEQSISSMTDELGERKGKTKTQIDSMKEKVIAYCKLAEPKILQTTINQFNYIMQPYSFIFPYNSSMSQRAMIHDVNAIGDFGGVEMPAVLTIRSKKSNNVLTIQTDTDYDKDFLLEQIKKKHKNMDDVKTSDIFLSDKVETVFAIKNSWIISHKSDVVFELKEVKVINQTIITFQ